jgi:hypothetical protein
VLPVTPAVLHADATVSAARLAWLRDVLPGVNLVHLVERYPPLLTRDDASFFALEGRLHHLQDLLPSANAACVLRMVESHPSLLFLDVDDALVRLKERMPGRDVDLMVAQNPSLLLKQLQEKKP